MSSSAGGLIGSRAVDVSGSSSLPDVNSAGRLFKQFRDRQMETGEHIFDR